MLTVVFAFTIGPAVRPASGLTTPKAETTATKTIETATASTTIFPWVPRLALINEWFSICDLRAPLGRPGAGALARACGPGAAAVGRRHAPGAGGALAAARHRDGHGAIGADRAGNIERRGARVADRAVLDPDRIAIGAIAAAFLGDDEHAPLAVERRLDRAGMGRRKRDDDKCRERGSRSCHGSEAGHAMTMPQASELAQRRLIVRFAGNVKAPHHAQAPGGRGADGERRRSPSASRRHPLAPHRGYQRPRD